MAPGLQVEHTCDATLREAEAGESQVGAEPGNLVRFSLKIEKDWNIAECEAWVQCPAPHLLKKRGGQHSGVRAFG